MSQRKGIHVTHGEYAEPPPSPASQVPRITVEIRAHWPYGMGHEERVATLIRQLAHEAVLEVYPVVGDDEQG